MLYTFVNFKMMVFGSPNVVASAENPIMTSHLFKLSVEEFLRRHEEY